MQETSQLWTRLRKVQIKKWSSPLQCRVQGNRETRGSVFPRRSAHDLAKHEQSRELHFFWVRYSVVARNGLHCSCQSVRLMRRDLDSKTYGLMDQQIRLLKMWGCDPPAGRGRLRPALGEPEIGGNGAAVRVRFPSRSPARPVGSNSVTGCKPSLWVRSPSEVSSLHNQPESLSPPGVRVVELYVRG